MIQTPQIRSIEAINDLGEVNQQELLDVFSQKAGAWAFASSTPSVHNTTLDIPNRFAKAPEDGVVMEFLESYVLQCTTLPVGHLYDGALEDLLTKVNDETVKTLIHEDLELRYFLRARRIGEVYE